MKYEVTFIPKNGDAKCKNTLTFGDRDAVDVVKKVFAWAMTGYYSDIEVKKVKKDRRGGHPERSIRINLDSSITKK